MEEFIFSMIVLGGLVWMATIAETLLRLTGEHASGDRGICQCGYSRVGLADDSLCPECGSAWQPTAANPARKRGLVFLVGVPCVLMFGMTLSLTTGIPLWGSLVLSVTAYPAFLISSRRWMRFGEGLFLSLLTFAGVASGIAFAMYNAVKSTDALDSAFGLFGSPMLGWAVGIVAFFVGSLVLWSRHRKP